MVIVNGEEIKGNKEIGQIYGSLIWNKDGKEEEEEEEEKEVSAKKEKMERRREI